MIRLMSDCLLRISEAVTVNVEDIQDNILYIHRSKTNPDGLSDHDFPYVGNPTLNLIQRYKQKAGIDEGALFRRVRRGDHVQPTGLSISGARDAIKLWANIAGVDGFISGHSLRLSKCKRRGGGKTLRCRHTMQEQSWQNRAQWQGSDMEKGGNAWESYIAFTI